MSEGINISALKQKINDAVVGLEVTVEFQHVVAGLVKETGVVDIIRNWRKLELNQRHGHSMGIPFIGIHSGIYRIISNNNVIYENQGVLEAYKDKDSSIPLLWRTMNNSLDRARYTTERLHDGIDLNMPMLPEALELMEEGTFYLDI